jgi:hypothetical protein
VFVEFHLNLGDASTFDTTTWIQNGSQSDNVFVAVPGGKTLTDLEASGSTADISWNGAGTQPRQFTLSGVCGGKASPTISTTPSATGSGVTGDTLNDTADLAGGDNPTGTITFTLFDPAHSDCSGSGVYTDNVTVSGNGTYDTTAGDNPGGYVALTKGTYNWVASYSGDGNNNPADSGCGEEAFVVEAVVPTVTTAIHLDPETDPPTVVTEVDLGSSVHDSAAVSGPAALGTPTGSVDFKFYSGECGDDSNLSSPTTSRSTTASPTRRRARARSLPAATTTSRTTTATTPTCGRIPTARASR